MTKLGPQNHSDPTTEHLLGTHLLPWLPKHSCSESLTVSVNEYKGQVIHTAIDSCIGAADGFVSAQ